MKITLHTADFKQGWQCNISPAQARRLDNGHLISIGLILGTDIKQTTLDKWIKSGKAVEISAEKVNHTGCQSRCCLRGDSICQW